MGFIGDFMLWLGRLIEEKDRQRYRVESYQKYHGEWVNQGTTYDEEWVWVDEPRDPNAFIINVTEIKRGYKIVVDTGKDETAIEQVGCMDEKDIETTLNIMKAYYGILGDVVIERNI